MHLKVEMIVKKINRVSKCYSKNNKVDEHKNCLDGEKRQQECDNYIIRSISTEMVLQEIKRIYTFYFR